MDLTLKDRFLILNSVLPKYDTRKNIELIKSINCKLGLSKSESDQILATNLGNGQFEIGFKTAESITQESEFEFSVEEIAYMKSKIDYIDSTGMFSEFTMPTYEKIIEASESIE